MSQEKRRGLRRDALLATLLSAFIAGLWCSVTGRTSAEGWTTPLGYHSDGWFVLGLLKAARDGHVASLLSITVPELNAPFGASWNDFLRQHKIQLVLAGGLARVLGLFAAANLCVLLAHVLAGLSFYGVARSFRARREWALCGACAFAFTPFLFYRSLGHLTLSHYWPIPLAILVTSWAFGRRGVPVNGRRFWLGAVIAVVAGLHNIYYARLFAELLVLASLAQLLRGRRRLAPGPLLLLAALLLALLGDNANMLAHRWAEGPGLASLLRPYGNLERYALKPIELFLPAPGSGLLPWPGLSQAYAEGALYRGEMGSAYLGLAGIAGLAAMAFSAFRGWLRRRRGFLPSALVAVAWILADSVVGGLNGLWGTAGFVWFRATNRHSIWILALVLLWSVTRLSRVRWTRQRAASILAAALVGALALADQCPPWTPTAEISAVRSTMASDRTFVQSLEGALPSDAMLFVLPVLDFPEGPRVLRATDYEPLRLYLFSSRLRLSYGGDKGRPREEWQRRVEELPPEAMAAALESRGFDGLILNRKAYEDGGEGLRQALASGGRREGWQSPDRDFLFLRLLPAQVQ